MERVELTTSDGKGIIGNFSEAGKQSVILLHQFQQDKESYHTFQSTLALQSLSSLAIDFRGHGESEGKRERLTEDDFRLMINDAEAAAKFLRARNVHVIAIIGASISRGIAIFIRPALPQASTLLPVADRQAQSTRT